MNPLPENISSHAQDLTRALFDFFASREKKEFHPILRNLLSKLVSMQIERGRGFLNPQEVGEITENPFELKAVGTVDDFCPLVITKQGRLYFRKSYEYELGIARFFTSKVETIDSLNLDRAERFFQEHLKGTVDDYQALAIAQAMIKKWLILSGGPGTGKTRTLVVLLILLLEIEPDFHVAMVAPTGKAAYRLQQSVADTIDGLSLSEELTARLSVLTQTSTLHRLLGFVRGSVDFRRNANNPLPHDLVVVDEASMVDLPLMAKLLEALKPTARLILSGDADQLSPVQGGGVFNALAKGGELNKFESNDVRILQRFSSVAVESSSPNPLLGHIVSLQQSHRQGADQAGVNISEFCRMIKDGQGEDAKSFALADNLGIEMISSTKDPRVEKLIVEGFSELGNAEVPEQALSGLRKFRILCPHNLGKYGVDLWNQKAGYLVKSFSNQFLPLVIQMNDYGVDLFNGDDGVVCGDKAFFSSTNEMREIPKARLPKYDESFALSIHRSQGSEYDKVMIILPPPESKLLNRELLYVAASRAKSGIILVGDPESIGSAIQQGAEKQCGVVELI